MLGKRIKIYNRRFLLKRAFEEEMTTIEKMKSTSEADMLVASKMS